MNVSEEEAVKPRYREDKAAQASAVFLALGGSRMNYLKLMKLLYLAERESLLRWGRSITYDRFVSMDHGPVLSQTLNVLNGTYNVQGPWKKSISPPQKFEVELISSPGTGSLSRAEESLIEELYQKFGSRDQWELVEITHSLPEWRDPKGSSIPIEYKDILRAGDFTESDIEAILDEIDGVAKMEETL